jgi:hypothetical protein
MTTLNQKCADLRIPKMSQPLMPLVSVPSSVAGGEMVQAMDEWDGRIRRLGSKRSQIDHMRTALPRKLFDLNHDSLMTVV